MTRNTELSYDAALEELKTIQHQLSNEDLPLSELEKKVDRAYYLLQYCQEKLQNTSNLLREKFLE